MIWIRDTNAPPVSPAGHSVRFVRLRNVLVIVLPLILLAARQPQQTPNTSQDASWKPPLIIEADPVGSVQLSAGNSLAIHLALHNISNSPITIEYGVRLFVLEAQFAKPMPSAFVSAFPPRDSWGDAHRFEFPNPSSVSELVLRSHTLAPGERFPPRLISNRGTYRVPFDSVGTYSIRVCADLGNLRMCNRPQILVRVVSKDHGN